jgi:hypothetical protein
MKSILGEGELKENESRKKDLIDLISSEQALLFVGAGSSAFVGYKDWIGIIESLEKIAIKCAPGFIIDRQKRENDPLYYIEGIKGHIKRETGDLNRYYNCLYKEFEPKKTKLTKFHETLIGLPFKGFLTTNYDTVLEAALASKAMKSSKLESTHDNSLIVTNELAQRVSEFFMSLDYNLYPKRIAHLHGIYSDSNSIILSSGDYERAYGFDKDTFKGETGAWTLHKKLLWAILATRRVVFVGFSLNDPYLKIMLKLVSNDLWRWDDSIHYAIMGLSAGEDKANLEKTRAEYLKSNFGIGVVFYENVDGSHRALEHMVNDISRGCQSRQSKWMESINKSTERRLINED